ncbi:MAG: response regulator [Spirochaetia bacterium]|nr:response regulator [Spirochaetia bacterium]
MTTVETLIRGIFPKAIALELDLGAGIPLVKADPTHIHQVILNLCVNARDAMPSGGTLRISTRVEIDPVSAGSRERCVILTVSDTGSGMDEATRQRIFEPFFSTKERGRGTGLGLSLVFGIMESHGGRVTVDSEPGKGSAFHCYFPVPDEAPAAAQQQMTMNQPTGGTETILVVEDEPMMRDAVRELLESTGYTVLTADDGEQALSLYQENLGRISMVISDLGLPKMGGEELFKRLKILDPSVLLIIASGFIEPGVKSTLGAGGVQGFIQKPYDLDELLNAIEDVLRR